MPVTSYFLTTALIFSLLLVTVPEDGKQAPQDIPIQRKESPANGLFLVAKREMRDPNFQHTVVFLVNHDKDGTLGLIINRRSKLKFSEVAPEIKHVDESKHFLFIGGPVLLPRIAMLFRDNKIRKGMKHVVGDIYFSGDQDVLENLLENKKSQNELRIFAGHAGWAKGQLEYEVARGDWLIIKIDPAILFTINPSLVWDRLIDRIDRPGIQVQYDHSNDIVRRLCTERYAC
jgi:putative transcriptional regulator